MTLPELLSLAVLICLVALLLLSRPKAQVDLGDVRQTEVIDQSDEQPTFQHPLDPPRIMGSRFSYSLNEVPSNPYDRRLVQMDNITGQSRVIVESVKDAFEILDQEPNLTLGMIAYPLGGDSIVVQTTFAETDQCAGDLYILNIPDLTLKPLTEINAIYTGFCPSFALSPDQVHLAFASHADTDGLDQNLYVAHLLNDKIEKNVQLTGNETFNAGRYGLSSFYDMMWQSNTTLTYSIFDQSKKVPSYDVYTSEQATPLLVRGGTVIVQ